jgi:hypothetical protein
VDTKHDLITGREVAAESHRQMLTESVERSSNLIGLADGDGRLQYVNQALRDALQFSQTLNPSTGALLTSVGVPTFNWSGGGGNGIYYSSGCINEASYLSDYQIVASRELLY